MAEETKKTTAKKSTSTSTAKKTTSTTAAAKKTTTTAAKTTTTASAEKKTTTTAAKKTTTASVEKKTTSTTAKKTATTATASKKTAAPKVEAPVVEEAPVEEVKVAPKAKKVSKGNKVRTQTTRLLETYEKDVKKALMEKFKYTSPMQIPALSKIVINMGVGDATTNSKALEDAVKELGQITGQHPVTTRAKKSNASFKIREGQEIGTMVTLRGVRMYEFFDKLVSVALPRVRDFRGVSKNSFDGHGSYTLGIKEQLIFPEIEYDKISKIRGMNLTINTTAATDEEAFALLEALGMPFQK